MGQAVIVLGAGATRGCSIADPSKSPCLPPLDGDFFTQLQRVRNKKHQKLIQEVLEDVVGLFGYNFDATMETVFTTLEHTIRLLEATGRPFRNFDLGELRKKRERGPSHRGTRCASLQGRIHGVSEWRRCSPG